MADKRYRCIKSVQYGGKAYVKGQLNIYFPESITPPSGNFTEEDLQYIPAPHSRRVEMSVGGVPVGVQKEINLIEGDGIEFTLENDEYEQRVDLTIDTTSSGGVPNGGTTGQIIVKQSATDGDVAWQTPATGTGFEEVSTYGDLPDASLHTGEYYIVLTSTGFLWQQKRGLYRSDGVTWTIMARDVFTARTDQASIRDATDTTKRILFGASAITTGTDRTINMADADVDLADIALNNAHRETVTGNPHALDAGDVPINVVGSPGYEDLQDVVLAALSPGAELTGTAYITDAGSGNIAIAAGNGFLRTSDANNAALVAIAWSAVASSAIPAGTRRYVGVEYNSGSPQAVVRTSQNWNGTTDFELGEVVNEGGTLHIFNSPVIFNDVAQLASHRAFETRRLERAERIGGLILGETGTRYVTVTAGELYDRFNEFAIGAIDTSGTDDFDSYSSGGLESSADTQWDNANYDNAGTLTALTTNWFSTLWFYIESDGNLVCVYGTAQYATAAAAEAATVPSTLPLRVQAHGKLIGRIIFQQGESSAEAIESAFAVVFNGTLATDHGNLAGLSDDDHTQYLLASGSRALAGAWNMGNQALTNVNIDSGTINGITDLAVVDGGTGASTAAAARANLGVPNITVSASEPSTPATNDLWVDLS